MYVQGGESEEELLGVTGPYHFSCKNCKKRRMYFHFSTNYAQIYDIPFVSNGKKVRVICQACNTEYNVKEQSDALKAIIAKEKKQFKLPLKHFTGLLICLGLIVIFLLYTLLEEIVGGF